MRMKNERWPPEISSKMLLASPPDWIYFFFLKVKNSVMSNPKPVPTNTFWLALLTSRFCLISFLR